MVGKLKNFWALLLIILLNSCAVNTSPDISVNYTLSRRAAIHAWTKVFGGVSTPCIWYVKQFEEHERYNIDKHCGMGMEGCIDGYDIFILDWITPEEKLETGVHEYIHLISQCQNLGDDDPNHSRKKLWICNFEEKSVEAIGFDRVIDLYYKKIDKDNLNSD